MNTVTGVFGDQSFAACDAAPLTVGSNGNRTKILQYGLYSKGYNPTVADGRYTALTESAVKQVQTDAGLAGSQVSGIAKGMQVKAVLGVDEYKLVSGGDSQVRTIQQALNRQYLNYSGLCAADGVYGRSTATQLIYALQAEEGLPVSIANGNFGPTTKTWCPDLGVSSTQYGYGNVPYTQADLMRFQDLAEYALYCVGVDRYTGGSGSKYNPYGGVVGGTLWSALNKFQKDYGLAVRNMVGLDEWMSLLVSTGNPNRECPGCDCSTQLTRAKASALVFDGYSIIGRYLTGTVGAGANKRPKNLTAEEMETIFSVGLSLFCIYQDDEFWWQDHDDLSGYFGYDRGYTDAAKAVNAAVALGVPRGEHIYFAVDYDYMEGEVWQKVVPHFQGINDYMSEVGWPYSVGVYSARNTCGIVSAQGLASSSFVSDMSTGYSGNLGYPLPSNWAFDQVLEYTLGASDGSFGVDKNSVSGRDRGFSEKEVNVLRTTYHQEIGSVLNYQGGYSVDVANMMAIGYYGSDGSGAHEYSLATEALANTSENLRGLANVIKEVEIEITALNGARFDQNKSGNASGSYPPTDEKTILEDFVEGKARDGIIKFLLKKAVLLPGGFAGWVVKNGVNKLIDILADTDGASVEAETSSLKIRRLYRWNELQSQTNQTIGFFPVFPDNGGSVEVKYTVRCNPGNVIVSNTMIINNPNA